MLFLFLLHLGRARMNLWLTHLRATVRELGVRHGLERKDEEEAEEEEEKRKRRRRWRRRTRGRGV
eukprot:6259182-Pyramimonas_sp.AAC.1